MRDAGEPGSMPPIVGDLLGEAGVALPASARGRAEASLGFDFSGVRVHTNGRAQASARAVGARAYTVGHHVVFGEGERPDADGGRLLAHELAHVMQQSRPGAVQRKGISQPGDTSEREADTAAEAVVAGSRFTIAHASSGVQRKDIPSAGDAVTVVEAQVVGDVQIPAGVTVIVQSWRTQGETAIVYMTPPSVDAYEPVRVPKRALMSGGEAPSPAPIDELGPADGIPLARYDRLTHWSSQPERIKWVRDNFHRARFTSKEEKQQYQALLKGKTSEPQLGASFAQPGPTVDPLARIYNPDVFPQGPRMVPRVAFGVATAPIPGIGVQTRIGQPLTRLPELDTTVFQTRPDPSAGYNFDTLLWDAMRDRYIPAIWLGGTRYRVLMGTPECPGCHFGHGLEIDLYGGDVFMMMASMAATGVGFLAGGGPVSTSRTSAPAPPRSPPNLRSIPGGGGRSWTPTPPRVSPGAQYPTQGATALSVQPGPVVAAPAPALRLVPAPPPVTAPAPALVPPVSGLGPSIAGTAGVIVGGVGVAPQSGEPNQQGRDCRELYPTAISCEDGRDLDEVAVEFLMNQGYSFTDLGTCRPHRQFEGGLIDACEGAPGTTMHCDVTGSADPLSVFGCVCCNADGSTSVEWRSPHWSTYLGRRGR